MFESLSGAELLTIAVVALVIFGPGRLPDIARTIGRYVSELKAAVRDLRQGIEQEIGPLREPMKEIKEDLAKPVSDIRRSMSETAEIAKAAERDIKRSAKGTTGPNSPSSPPAPEPPQARWVAPEPPTGVSPSEVWAGMEDAMPETVHPPASEERAPHDGEPREPVEIEAEGTEAETPAVGDGSEGRPD